MNIIAIDLGKFNSMICFYNTTTQKHSLAKATKKEGYFRSVFENYPVDLVVIEACSPSGWVNDLCQKLKIPTIVCSTHEDAWLFKNVKRKIDKDDALKLARMASLGHLKPAHVPSTEMREPRRLIKYRKTASCTSYCYPACSPLNQVELFDVPKSQQGTEKIQDRKYCGQ